MKLCILDAKTLGDDADLSVFDSFGEVEVFPVTKPEEVVERIKDKDVIITNKVLLNQSNLEYAPNLKLICITATGTNNVDLNYTRQRNIVVTNVAGYSTHSVTQHTFSMLFYLLGKLRRYDDYVKSGSYAQSDIFTHLAYPFAEIRGKTWGIIGLGAIGRSVASIAAAFGCRVVYYSTTGKNNTGDFERVELEKLLTLSDIVSIHCPLTPETKNLLNADNLHHMKKEAILLNLGRGGIVHEGALAEAIDEGRIAGAGVDVLEAEPIRQDNPLLAVKRQERLLITPHIAWASIEARRKLVDEVRLNIDAFLKGENRNRV